MSSRVKNWLRLKVRRHIIHNEEACYKCGILGQGETPKDDVLLTWHREKVGRITYEEGYLCPKCVPEEPESTIEFKIFDTPLPPTQSVEDRISGWIDYIKEFEEGDEKDSD